MQFEQKERKTKNGLMFDIVDADYLSPMSGLWASKRDNATAVCQTLVDAEAYYRQFIATVEYYCIHLGVCSSWKYVFMLFLSKLL